MNLSSRSWARRNESWLDATKALAETARHTKGLNEVLRVFAYERRRNHPKFWDCQVLRATFSEGPRRIKFPCRASKAIARTPHFQLHSVRNAAVGREALS